MQSNEQLERLYESAAVSKDLDLMKSIRMEVQTRKAAFFKREKDFDEVLFNKLPKKIQVENIIDIGKDKTVDGTRYRAVIKFEDGYTRSIAEYTLSDFKYYLKNVLKNRNYEQ
jgi:hypothetical protein